MNNSSRNFFDNDDDLVIDFTKFNKDSLEENIPQANESNIKFTVEEEPQEEKTSDFDLATFSMEGAEKQTSIYREEKEGYVIQKTVIIEKKKIPTHKKIDPIDQALKEEQNNTSYQENINLFTPNPSIIIDDEPHEPNANEQVHEKEEQDQKSLFNSIASLINQAIHRIVIFFIFSLLFIVLIFIIYSILKPNAREEFSTIINSIDPIKAEVEKCILSENVHYIDRCNSNNRSNEQAWDLSNRFLNENKHDGIANIVIEGGTITINSNYTNNLKGANYILVPQVSPNHKVLWNISKHSTCFEKHLC